MPPKKKDVGPTAEEKLQQLSDRVKREEELGVESMQELNIVWLGEFRASLSEDLRHDIDLARQLFERVIMTKNRVIKTLSVELTDAQQQQAQAQICHLQFQDKLQALQEKRLAAVDTLWTGGQEELSVEFDSEWDGRMAKHWEEIGYLKDVYEVMSQRDFDMKFYSNLDFEGLNEAMERMQLTKTDFATRDITAYQEAMDKKAALMEENADQYTKAIADFKAALQELQDRSETKKILKQARKMRRLQRLRDTMVLEQESSVVGTGREGKREREFADMKVITDKAKVKGRQVKQRMTRERTAAQDRLTRLVMNTSAAEKRLRDTRTKGERLLFRFEMCIKLASEHGRLPPAVTPEEAAHATEPLSRETAEALTKYREMEGFWQRYNKARLEQLNLRKEEAALTRENQHLTALVRHYTEF